MTLLRPIKRKKARKQFLIFCSLSRVSFLSLSLPLVSLLPDPVRRFKRRLLAKLEHGVRAVVEQVPGERGRVHGGGGGIGTIARRTLASFPSSPIPLLRSRRRAREEQQRCEEQGRPSLPHRTHVAGRGEKERANCTSSLLRVGSRPERRERGEIMSTQFPSLFIALLSFEQKKENRAKERHSLSKNKQKMLRRGLATLGGRMLAAACETSSAALASATSSGSGLASASAAAIRGAAVASSSSSSSTSFWRGELLETPFVDAYGCNAHRRSPWRPQNEKK